MNKIISLNGSWNLKCLDPYVPLRDSSMETGKPLQGLTGWIDAPVPGGVHAAMYRAGFIPYPYEGMNSLACEWLEHRWWIYRREFDLSLPPDAHAELCFEGVDYRCRVYLNQVLLGEHEGMFDPFHFDISKHCRGQTHFTLECLIWDAPREMGQIGLTSLTSTQKSRFGYKWDFSTHLVNLGIWQDVFLRVWQRARFDEVFVSTDHSDGVGLVRLQGSILCDAPYEELQLAAELRLSGLLKAADRAVVQKDGSFALTLNVPSPELWYANGLGAQTLYHLSAHLMAGEEEVDLYTQRCGIRHIDYCINPGAPEDSRPYTVCINGRRVYMKGVNLVPLDHAYGDVKNEQRKALMRYVRDMHANTVRVWGGGLIGTRQFYDLCDEMGILVWQEFIQSSSGIDNMPSHDPAFLALLCKSAESAIKRCRNHTSLVLWSGGNELMTADKIPVDESDPNIAMLARLVHALDPERLFLPSSPSGPVCHISSTPNLSHDVHGWWQYQGNPRQYSYFGDSDSLLHSEFGCDGMSSFYTVSRVTGTLDIPPRPMLTDDLWRFHGDWWCTWEREKAMFGETSDLCKYILISQWMQAEGLRFILEANRLRQPRNSGSIIWQMNEPWPNLSCTSLVDYYLDPKMAYYWARNAFARVHACLTYRRLDYAPGSSFATYICLLSDDMKQREDAVVVVQVLDLQGKCYLSRRFSCSAAPGSAQAVSPLRFKVPKFPGDLFLVRLKLRTHDETSVNDYWFSNAEKQPYAAALRLTGARLEAKLLKTAPDGGSLLLKNSGAVAILHAQVFDPTGENILHAEQNCVTLLPDEEMCIPLTWRPRPGLAFDPEPGSSDPPRLVLRALGLKEAVEVSSDE